MLGDFDLKKWCLALVAVSLWAVAAAQTGVQCSVDIADQCPEKDDPGNPVFLPNPDDCSQYCECSNGYAWLFDCPPGTLFDEYSKRCIMEVDANCGSRPLP
ncbi:peritrophin-1-like isoform X2 [Eriocheir sinensis]|uniref:peritrophin-1-like isoform X2 n=1 Tax=Eriocheir sinensis TaxID=95602 RepID=UPI0021C5B50C|nr:peritrophin-1-like isoform X2 [Eriocheir sinensis]